jgi:hypothetical protein
MAENKVSVEITLEEKAALKALTQLTREVQKTEGGFKKMGDSGDKSLGVLGKATDGAASGFKSLVGGVTVANLASSAIIGTANAIKDFVVGSINAAIEQENAINKLSQALRANGEFSRAAMNDFSDFASELQNVTVHGDETVLNQLALAKSLGATNDQAKNLVKAAAELSATLGGSLEENVDKLGKALNGNIGRLGQYIPELKNLTKAQLESGAASDLIINKFGGAAASELNTYGGAVKSATNAMGDFQEELGNLIIKNKLVIETINGSKSLMQTMASVFKDLGSVINGTGLDMAQQAEALNGLSVKYENLTIRVAAYQKQLDEYDSGKMGFFDKLTFSADAAKESITRLKAEQDKLLQQMNSSSPFGDPKEEGSGKQSTGMREEDKKLVDSRKQALAQLKIAEAEYDAYQNERRLASVTLTDENRALELEQLMAFEQQKIDAKFAAEEQKALMIEDAQTREINQKKIATDKLVAMDKARADATKRIDQQVLIEKQVWASNITGIAGVAANAASVFAKEGSRELFLIQKAAALAQATTATYLAMAMANAVPPPGNIPAIAAAKANGAIAISGILASAIKGYEKGGIIPGTSYTGDNVMARVNSGEMVLNKEQQKNLFDMANGKGGTDGSIKELISALNNQPINLIVDGRAIATVVRKQVQDGFRLA